MPHLNSDLVLSVVYALACVQVEILGARAKGYIARDSGTGARDEG